MALEIRRVQYYHTTVPDRPGEALRFLTALSERGINLLAFTAIPVGLWQTQLTIFPDDAGRFEMESGHVQLGADGPHGAILVQGRDTPGALVEVHEKLYEADVNVSAATAVSSGAGRYGYVIYVRPDELEPAARALGL